MCDSASSDSDDSIVSKLQSDWNVTFSCDRVSLVTSDGFFSSKKCLVIPVTFDCFQDSGGVPVDGLGGSSTGKVAGIGLAGGGRSFCVSCCPANRWPGSLISAMLLPVQFSLKRNTCGVEGKKQNVTRAQWPQSPGVKV